MTKEELLTKLKGIIKRDDNDPEIDHQYADDLLIAYINDEEIAAAYEEIGKWYA